MTKPNFTFNIKNYSVEVIRHDSERMTEYEIFYTSKNSDDVCYMAQTKLGTTWTVEDAKKEADDFIHIYEVEMSSEYDY
jgi:hypothetical protein